MFKKISDALGLGAVERFSVARFKHTEAILDRNLIVSKENCDLMVETIREISEIVIWGDGHNQAITEVFLEHHVLEKLLSYFEPARRTPKPVKVQILQTLSIFFQNLQSDTIIFYLLSNNHLNELITHRFDFHDDELMSYYISFLKALSLRLNADTIHFFFNPGKVPEFPLLTEALRFAGHEDHMVRTAVRMVTLHVYRIEDEDMRAFVATRTATAYFSNLVWDLLRRYRQMDRLIQAAGRVSSPRELLPLRGSLESLLQEQLDVLFYVKDIYTAGVPPLSATLSSRLLHQLLTHVCFEALAPEAPRTAHLSPAPDGAPGAARYMLDADPVCRALALFVLAQVSCPAPLRA